MGLLFTLVTFFVGIGILIFVHELGHFLAARWVGARVEIFSIGFGKRLFGIKRGETDYRVSLFPLGGYVKITGQEGFEELEGADYELASKSIPERFLVFFAGPGMNYLFAIFAFAGIAIMGIDRPLAFTERPVVSYVAAESAAAKVGVRPGDQILSVGRHEVDDWQEVYEALGDATGTTVRVTVARGDETRNYYLKRPAPEEAVVFPGFEYRIAPEVSGLVPDSPAEQAGIQVGDRIAAVNGKPIGTFQELQSFVAANGETPVDLTIERGDTTLKRELVPAINPETERPAIGIYVAPKTKTEYSSVTEALQRGLRQTAEVNAFLFKSIADLFTSGAGVDQLGGPVTIARVTSQVAERGLQEYIGFLALLSINLALLNLLPVPVLDGGHILFLFFELFLGRDLTNRLKLPALQIGLILLLTLTIFVLFNDVRMLGQPLPQ